MKIFYDTEFIENGETIDLISIGMVAEDGREYYGISRDFSLGALQRNPWLMANVAPSLPLKAHSSGGPWDTDHADYGRVLTRRALADDVRTFIQATPDAQLWAWYAAYDHVALCQLWGRMIDLPHHVPMFTNDLKQEAVRLGDPSMPTQEAGEHNALADARHNLAMARFLESL